MLDDLAASEIRQRILFLEAGEQTLLTRYKETRRRHPLAPRGGVAEGIAREQELLAPLRGRADVVIDTSGLTATMLRRRLTDELLPNRTPGRLAITFQSFGFKYGPSRDADLQLDVRFLPNPHYEPTLRPLTGRDRAVVEFIDRDGALEAFYERLHPLLDYLLPQYVAEGKAHLVVGIGCTGGPASLGGDRRAPRRALPRRGGLPDRRRAPRHRRGAVIDHIGFEVSDLGASVPLLRRAVLRARGAAADRLRARRRLRDQRADDLVRRPRSAAGSRLRARGAAGHPARRRSTAPTPPASPTADATTARPGSGPSTGGATTPPTCSIPTACGWRSCSHR